MLNAILALTLVIHSIRSGAARCVDYLAKHKKYVANCKKPFFSATGRSYYRLSISGRAYVLLENNNELSRAEPKAIGVGLPLAASETIDDVSFYVYELGDYTLVDDLLTQGRPMPLIDIYQAVIEPLETLRKDDDFIVKLASNSVVYNPELKKALFLDVLPAESEDAFQIQLNQLQLFVDSLAGRAALVFGEAVGQADRMEFIDRYDEFLSYLKEYSGASFSPLYDRIVELNRFTIAHVEPTDNQDGAFVTFEGKKTGQKPLILDNISKSQEVILILTVSLIVLATLGFTVLLVASKVPNMNEEDYEMRMVSRPSSVVA